MDSAHASGGHDTPSVVLLSSRPGEGTVSAKDWTIRPGSGSAHSPAATGSESAVWPTRYLPLGLRRSRVTSRMYGHQALLACARCPAATVTLSLEGGHVHSAGHPRS